VTKWLLKKLNEKAAAGVISVTNVTKRKLPDYFVVAESCAEFLSHQHPGSRLRCVFPRMNGAVLTAAGNAMSCHRCGEIERLHRADQTSEGVISSARGVVPLSITVDSFAIRRADALALAWLIV